MPDGLNQHFSFMDYALSRPMTFKETDDLIQVLFTCPADFAG
jgi:hypothetical protein